MSKGKGGYVVRRRGVMPIERLALRMLICDGELIYNRLQWREDFVDDADVAIKRLQAGQVVWVVQYGPLITQVQRAIEGERVKVTA